MIYRVEVDAAVLEAANHRFGESRSALGRPSEYDFVAGPSRVGNVCVPGLRALSFDVVETVRYYTVVDPFFGPVTFVGLLRDDAVVEIVRFADDPDYWSQFEEGAD